MVSPAFRSGSSPLAVLIGTAKPMPTEPWPPPVAICELMPITRPLASSSGPPGVAGVDRGVGLDHVRDREAVGRLDLALEAGDDAGGDRAAVAERVADRDHRVADLRLRGVAERDRGEAAAHVRGIDLQDRDVGGGVHALHVGVDELAVLVEAHLDAVRALDHMGVGDDRAVVVDHEARAGRGSLLRSRRTVTRCPMVTPWDWMKTTPRPSSL